MNARRRGHASCILVLLLARGTASAEAQGLDEIARSEIASQRPGLVVMLRVNGQTQYAAAYGSSGLTPGAALDLETLFPYPALSEVTLGILIEALHAQGVVDQDAPISTYMSDLSQAVGVVTLRQLVTHLGGIDDAERIEGETWERTLDRVDDESLVAQPGAFYSRSRLSSALAARVLSVVIGRPFVELASVAVLAPLGATRSTFAIDEARARGLVPGVERTNDLQSGPVRTVESTDTVAGLPVLFTTASDALTLLSAWTEGRIAGRPPHEIAGEPRLALHPSRRFGGGVWVDEYSGLSRASRSESVFGISTSFHLIPEAGTTIFVWSRGDPPTRVINFLLEAVAEAAGAAPVDPPGPPALEPGAAGMPDVDTDWAGTYRNGHLILVLRESAGRLVFFDGARELPLGRRGDTRVVATLPDGRVALVFELVRDEAGRRYLSYDGLVYRHEADTL